MVIVQSQGNKGVFHFQEVGIELIDQPKLGEHPMATASIYLSSSRCESSKTVPSHGPASFRMILNLLFPLQMDLTETFLDKL